MCWSTAASLASFFVAQVCFWSTLGFLLYYELDHQTPRLRRAQARQYLALAGIVAAASLVQLCDAATHINRLRRAVGRPGPFSDEFVGAFCYALLTVQPILGLVLGADLEGYIDSVVGVVCMALALLIGLHAIAALALDGQQDLWLRLTSRRLDDVPDPANNNPKKPAPGNRKRPVRTAAAVFYQFYEPEDRAYANTGGALLGSNSRWVAYAVGYVTASAVLAVHGLDRLLRPGEHVDDVADESWSERFGVALVVTVAVGGVAYLAAALTSAIVTVGSGRHAPSLFCLFAVLPSSIFLLALAVGAEGLALALLVAGGAVALWVVCFLMIHATHDLAWAEAEQNAAA